MTKPEQIVKANERIVEALHGHLRDQRPVLLYNVFHGVPITYERASLSGGLYQTRAAYVP
jgi:hypothetical protein